MMKKPPEHLPPLKEEVRKIGSRKVGTSMKRLLEGIDRVRELMVARQNSTLIRTQCDAIVASSGGGVCHDPPDTQTVHDLPRQPVAGARGQAAHTSQQTKVQAPKQAAVGGAAVTTVSAVSAISVVTAFTAVTAVTLVSGAVVSGVTSL